MFQHPYLIATTTTTTTRTTTSTRATVANTTTTTTTTATATNTIATMATMDMHCKHSMAKIHSAAIIMSNATIEHLIHDLPNFKSRKYLSTKS